MHLSNIIWIKKILGYLYQKTIHMWLIISDYRIMVMEIQI